MSGGITVAERIVLYLSNYSKFQDDYDVPLDVTQDGIASALRISRAHAAIELKKLKEREEVKERLAHVKGGKARRKVYFLTIKGRGRSKEIEEYAENEGIDLIPLLDLRRCDGEQLWESLEEKWKPILGKACIFRKPFDKEVLPEISISLLPEEDGKVDMVNNLKESIPQLLTEEERRKYHSFAADYWLDENDYRERLYHLINACRTMEAEMLLGLRGEELLKEADEGLLEILSSLEPESERYVDQVMRIKARTALRAGDHERCRKFIEDMRESGGPETNLESDLIEGELLMREGNHSEAYKVLNGARSEERDLRLECRMANCLIEKREYQEAEELLYSLIEQGFNGEGGDRVAEIYFLLGRIALRREEGTEALKLISKSLGMTSSSERSRWYGAMAKAYEMTGMEEKAREFRSKAT